MLHGLMMDAPLMISSILEHAARSYPENEIVSRTVSGKTWRYTYARFARRTKQLANYLIDLGVRPGDRVATLAWNTHRHLELYYAVSGIGAVCHTINPRLGLDELAYIMNDAGDVALFFDTSFAPLATAVAPLAPTVRNYIALADEDETVEVDGVDSENYEVRLAAFSERHDWAEFDERTASGLCYTSGTTGRPKGVLYSHRSTMLHALSCALPASCGVTERDAILPVVPLFHVNAWGLPHVAPLIGAKIVMAGPFLDGASLTRLMNEEEVTFSAGVPTIWHGIIRHLEESGDKLPSVKRFLVGGSALPQSMIRYFEDKHGIETTQGWGMTETSPLCTVGALPSLFDDVPREQEVMLKARQGRAVWGVDMKVMDDAGNTLPWDGKSSGHLMVKGPWICSRYFNRGDSPLVDGWFPTGDIAFIDEHGFMQITDRAKDLIKSGGEWISSIDLENAAMSHPAVAQAAAIGVRHERWDERPVLVAVLKPGLEVTEQELTEHIAKTFERWQLPDAIIFADALPLGATGKVLKTKLREEYGDILLDRPSPVGK